MLIPFYFKKIIELFLLPLPIGLFLILIGIILLIMHRAKLTRFILLSLGFLTIFTFGLEGVSSALINALQSQYKPLLILPKAVTQIVVLGGGISGKKDYPPNLTLNSASLSRLIEGIRLFDQLEEVGVKPTLILSGGRVFQSDAVAGKMQNTALMLGISTEQTILENGSRDTREEAIYLKKIIGMKHFILVTSAYHMPRSIALFKAQGMYPIAAPTQFYDINTLVSAWFVPSAKSLLISDTAIHEYLGIWWEKINHHIGA
ncbi:MAG: Integral membrane protein [uncultured bacterium]|nr:MAG: Integral membrane protein [uncultured bacterium]